MNKFRAILYTFIFILAVISRFFECLFEAMLQSRCVSLSFFVEVFRSHWNDERYYTPISQHVSNIKDLWNE